MSCMLLTDQDSVRLLAVDSCGPLARLLTRDESAAHVLPVVQKFAAVCLSAKLSCICGMS